jgi:hypothetical protein
MDTPVLSGIPWPPELANLVDGDRPRLSKALDRPNSWPRMAGPMNGTAGAEAVNAASALVLVRAAKTMRDSRKNDPVQADNGDTQGRETEEEGDSDRQKGP